jgi:selenide,water dikinase
MTDVSGFGLIGHLGEMLTASGADAALDLAAIPIYSDVSALAGDGVTSTLLPENLARLGLLRGAVDEAIKAVLFDPQTSGGLLAGIPENAVASCLSELRSAGYPRAAVVGQIKRIGLAQPEVSISIASDRPTRRALA